MLGKLWKATPSNGLWGDSPTAENSSSIVQDGPEAHKTTSLEEKEKENGRSLQQNSLFQEEVGPCLLMDAVAVWSIRGCIVHPPTKF